MTSSRMQTSLEMPRKHNALGLGLVHWIPIFNPFTGRVVGGRRALLERNIDGMPGLELVH